MQFTNIIAALALAMTASAIPTYGGNSNPDTSIVCSNNNQPVCCNGGLLGGILCTVAALGGNLGGSCEGSSYCCDTSAAPGTFINIQALNCLKVH
ncbi:hypothetical protein VTI74DRAFT_792 [Chaetomium olivicolor]